MNDSAPTVSIVVPNWNGRAFLGRCLSAAIQSAQAAQFPWELIVVDDASTDGSAAVAEKQFPCVKWFHNETNLGFGRTACRGIAACRGEFVVLLNNDLVAKESLIRELVKPLFDDPACFGVSGKTIEWGTNAPNHLNMFAAFDADGFSLCYEDSDTLAETMFIQGGCCVFRRDVFATLGGFWSGYSPGYWEDYDLSYLALKAGYKNMYNPSAAAYHFGQGSMTRAFGSERIAVIRERNRLMFLLLNLTDKPMLQKELSRWPSRIAYAVADRTVAENRHRIKGLRAMMAKLSAIRDERRRRAPLFKVSDADIFARFASRGIRA